MAFQQKVGKSPFPANESKLFTCFYYQVEHFKQNLTWTSLCRKTKISATFAFFLVVATTVGWNLRSTTLYDTFGIPFCEDYYKVYPLFILLFYNI